MLHSLPLQTKPTMPTHNTALTHQPSIAIIGRFILFSCWMRKEKFFVFTTVIISTVQHLHHVDCLTTLIAYHFPNVTFKTRLIITSIRCELTWELRRNVMERVYRKRSGSASSHNLKIQSEEFRTLQHYFTNCKNHCDIAFD